MTAHAPTATHPTAVHIVSLGCARNDVDSEELAARLAVGGFTLVDDPDAADAVMVNTCGFIEAAKKDSIDTLLDAMDTTGEHPRAVVAVGCMAERYGVELAAEVPEVAVLGFDDYDHIADRLNRVVGGEHLVPHVPRDRRSLLPIAPADRPAVALSVPGHGTAPDLPSSVVPDSGPRAAVLRRRLTGGPMAPIKVASGCDRRCSFCAIPAFRGAYVSRPVADVVAEASWLASQDVKEVFLVSENTTSYGKDLGDLRSLEKLLTGLSGVDGLDWIRVSYLQPAEMRPSLIDAICGTDKVVPYFDLSFQHASNVVLRRMRRFGDPESFLALIDRVRAAAPTAGIRSNVITGFPGETEADVQTLADFLAAARLDAIGVFGYSDEDGTEAERLDGKVPPAEVEERRGRLADLAEDLVSQRAEERIGERVQVLVEERADGIWTGRAAHQGPEVDGSVSLTGSARYRVGELVEATVVDSYGVDLVAEASAAGSDDHRG